MFYRRLFRVYYLQKIFILILFLFPSLSFAHFVPENRAKELALKVLNLSQKSRSVSISLEIVDNGLEGATRTLSNPPYYVFNNAVGKGFVIVSGEDAAMPVLGYSIDHNFTREVPLLVKEWLVDLSNQISWIRKNRVQPSFKTLAIWNEMAVQGPKDPILQLETANWEQYRPYNDDCFVIDGRHAVTGCVATATAIVMRYHQWPDVGIGPLPSYSFDDYVVPSRELTPYDWDNMPLVYTSSATTEQKKEVARLMADCGVMLKSVYGLNATEAYTADVPMGIGKFMKYDKGARFLLREDFSELQWHEMLQKNLQQCGPIIYKGVGDMGGHSFVIDGYTPDSFYSVNWGWGGLCNGFFLLDAMEPVIYGSKIPLNDQQGAVLGIRKDVGGNFIEDIRFKKTAVDGIAGLKASTETFEKNIPFDVTVNGIVNAGSSICESIDFLLALTDKEGNKKLELKQWNVQNLRVQYVADEYKATCMITSDILPGDRIRLFYRSSSNEWKLIKSSDCVNIPWEIIVKKEELIEPLDKSIALHYDRLTKLVKLKLKKGIDVTLSNLKGDDYSSLLIFQDNECNFSARELKLDTYILHFVRGNETVDLKIIIGKN